jgi:hypothetical protein
LSPGVGIVVPVQLNVSAVDFVNAQIGQIAGVVYLDTGNDGQRDSADVGVAGVIVYLDLNGNAIHDPGEPATTTGAFGRYSFSGLAEGTYQVRLVMPRAHSTRAPRWGVLLVSLSAGSVASPAHFGLVRDSEGPRLESFHLVRTPPRPARLILSFNKPLDPLSVARRKNYTLIAAGRDGRLGTRDDRVIQISPSHLRPAHRHDYVDHARPVGAQAAPHPANQRSHGQGIDRWGRQQARRQRRRPRWHEP